MRVIVVGATGLVGNALLRAWEARGDEVLAATFHRHPGTAFRQLDMRDEAAVRDLIAGSRPDVVAVPAANPHVDYCELHPAETRRTNVEGTLNVARACDAAGARMIFFSTDYVFDGRRDVYAEDDPVSPLNEYGRQKAEVEKALAASHLVVRTSGAYGWQWEPKNFVLQIKTRLSAGQRMRVAGDLSYNPTAVENLAEVVVALAGRSGIYHVAGGERIGRYDFAVRAARCFGLDASLLDRVSSAEFKAAAPRPRSSTLSTDKARRDTGLSVWGVDEGLRRMTQAEAAWRRYAAERLPAVTQKPV